LQRFEKLFLAAKCVVKGESHISRVREKREKINRYSNKIPSLKKNKKGVILNTLLSQNLFMESIMKKFKITMMAIITVLFLGLFIIGCSDGGGGDNIDPDPDTSVKIQGNLLILQAYGNKGDGSPAGVSHSFVELYNISDKAINLNGITLYYANGIRSTAETPAVTEDEAWETIALSGTIPAKGSFLILGAKHSDLSGTRYIITDGYGDINNDNLSLNRRGFKVALIKGTAQLTIQNPFDTNGNGAKVSGYIDMVGALNDPDHATQPDHIFGYETAPARNSASVAVRRQDLTDTDNNSNDFIEARYALTGDGAFTNEMLEVRKPRNSSVGEWNPFDEPGEPVIPTSPPAATGNTLLIFQAYGGDNANGVTHHFVELYNNGDDAVNLNGYSLQYAAASDGDTLESDWTVITLTGSIPSKSSYLILGKKNNAQTQRIQIADNSGDVNDSNFVLSNRGFKVALINGTAKLTAANPYNTDGSWTKAAGYIDLVGCSNTFGTNIITGYEGPAPLTALPRNSAQEGIRRENLTDTDNNDDDFASVRYTSARSANYPHGVDVYEIAFYKPKNSTAGTWDPLTPPEKPPETGGSEKLMILQANTYGNNNGLDQTPSSVTGGGFARSLVELYNNTDVAINLTEGNYYLHIGSNSAWSNIIKLEGSIPAKCSFLIVDNTPTASSNTNATPRAVLPAADQEAAFVINNTNFKIALLTNQSSILSAANPFDETSLTADYIDMLGTGSAAGESTKATASRPQGPRRVSLTDTDKNADDFAQGDFRGYTTVSGTVRGIPDSELYKIWPRNAAAGAWNPITGLPKIDPVAP
jgi:hypothetical protein